MLFPSVTLLQGTSEAHEDKHVYCEQVGQKDVSRAGAARQQPGKVEAPASEPASAHNHPAFHLEVQTGNSQKPWGWFIYTGSVTWPVNEFNIYWVPCVLLKAGLGWDWELPTPLLFPSRYWSPSDHLWTDWKQHNTNSVKCSAVLNMYCVYVCETQVSQWVWASPLCSVLSKTQRLFSRLPPGSLICQTQLQLKQPVRTHAHTHTICK